MRPYHVQTAWYWFPDATVNDAMIQVKSVSLAHAPASQDGFPAFMSNLEDTALYCLHARHAAQGWS